MSTSLQKRGVATRVGNRLATMASPQARETLAVGRRQGREFSVLGHAPMPTEPVRLDKWLIVPVEQDPSPIPEEAVWLAQAVASSGVPLQGFALVHEAPKALPAPAEAKKEPTDEPLRLPVLPPALRTALTTTAVALGTIALGLALVAGVVLVAMAVAALASMFLLPLVLVVGAAAGIDPILIAVTEDGCWIELYRWDV